MTKEMTIAHERLRCLEEECGSKAIKVTMLLFWRACDMKEARNASLEHREARSDDDER